MLRQRNPITDSFCKYGLHFPEEEVSSPNEQEEVDDAVMACRIKIVPGR